MSQQRRITAVLGPTNTGKTHYAIERMLGHRTGIIGLPLRLLAREVYDKIVAARGPSVVALVTGEERIVPPRAQYWVCTVEAMPEGMGADFLAVDEIQLCADPERGHVFTDRLLRARGQHETLFLGSDSMRGIIRTLVPEADLMSRERMSQLSYGGARKISRMQARSAIVSFSVENVYAIAELLKRQKGGAAVVMGALSPRTRNAQVELYQNGDVDFLVATDAIGMGLNLDINHVAFSATQKFDGRRMRALMPHELGQIAGRAGRGMSHGTFGVTGEAPPLSDEVADAIMRHRFAPVKKLIWRNPRLEFGHVEALVRSLEKAPDNELLVRARDADDLGALKTLSQDAETFARASDPASVRLLWDVCCIPDFRGISPAEHAALLGQIYAHLHEHGQIPEDWLARHIKQIDRTSADIDTLSKRLAYIRTWTYVAQRNGWIGNDSHWRDVTRAVEDRLSDALHSALTQRFVDRRTSVLLRRLKQKEAMLAEVNDKGEVTVEGEYVGRLEGFRFSSDQSAAGQEAKTLKQASLAALAPHFHLRADRFYNAPDTELDFTEQGGLMWGESAVGKLVKGAEPLKPQVKAFVDDEAGADVAEKVTRRLQHFIDRKIATAMEPLLALSRDEELTGLARGFAFQMVEALGILPRVQAASEIKALDQDARGSLRKHGLRFGQFTVFMPLLLKPAPTRLRLVLWSLWNDLGEFPEAPPPGLVTVPRLTSGPKGTDTMAGYRNAGERAIRIDMLERLADMLRAEDSRGGFEASADMLSITGMTLEQFADLMQGLGYKAERGEREKVKPADTVTARDGETGSADGAPVMDSADPAPGTDAAAGDAPDASDIPEKAARMPDDGIAPVAEEAPETPETKADIAETPAEEIAPGTAPDEKLAGPETEVFYTFTWAGNRGGRKPQEGGRGKSKGKPKGKGKPKTNPQGARAFEAKPPKKDKIDPDNPFAAALMGLTKKD